MRNARPRACLRGGGLWYNSRRCVTAISRLDDIKE